jgi:hypothetical protein
MMDNRISELKYKFYMTHRKHELSLTISLSDIDDDPDEFILSGSHPNPASLSASKDRVLLTRAKLSPVAREVFDVLIYGDERLNEQLRISHIRAKAVYKDFKVKIRPFHVADALMISEREVLNAYDEIRSAYREVNNDNK